MANYGFLMGLGEGLKNLGPTAQAWFSNKQDAERQKSLLETEALRRTLLGEQIESEKQLRPLQMSDLESSVAERQARTQSTQLGDFLQRLSLYEGRPGAVPEALRQEASHYNLGDGLFDAEGRLTVHPLTKLKIDAERARIATEQAQAAAAARQGRYYDWQMSRGEKDRDIDLLLRYTSGIGQMMGPDLLNRTDPAARYNQIMAPILEAVLKDPELKAIFQKMQQQQMPQPNVGAAGASIFDVPPGGFRPSR